MGLDPCVRLLPSPETSPASPLHSSHCPPTHSHSGLPLFLWALNTDTTCDIPKSHNEFGLLCKPLSRLSSEGAIQRGALG